MKTAVRKAFDLQNTLISLPCSFRSRHVSVYLSGNSGDRSQQQLPFQRFLSICLSQPTLRHWSMVGTSSSLLSWGPVWSGKQQDEAALKKKVCTRATVFIYCRLWKRKDLETVMAQEIIMVQALSDQANKCFLFGSASDLGNRGWVWVQDKGPSVRCAAQALCSEIIPANAQTNVCSTVLMLPPETSSTRRKLENKRLPNPNIEEIIGESFLPFPAELFGRWNETMSSKTLFHIYAKIIQHVATRPCFAETQMLFTASLSCVVEP